MQNSVYLCHCRPLHVDVKMPNWPCGFPLQPELPNKLGPICGFPEVCSQPLKPQEIPCGLPVCGLAWKMAAIAFDGPKALINIAAVATIIAGIRIALVVFVYIRIFVSPEEYIRFLGDIRS
jgi:hypothetical protein